MEGACVEEGLDLYRPSLSSLRTTTQRPEYIYLLLLLYPPMPRSTSCEFVPPPIQPVLNTQHPPPPPPLSVPPPPMPDLPSSPRKTVSSVSANARSQTQKKPGAPKPKGAVRAKSGCYTCRIRRKVCVVVVVYSGGRGIPTGAKSDDSAPTRTPACLLWRKQVTHA